MKKELKIFLAIVAAFLAAALYITILSVRNEKLKADCGRYRANVEVLSSDCAIYRLRDSLSAARVMALELSLDEFERYRAADAALIRELKQKNRDLSAVNDVQAQTIIDMAARPRDTVIVIDSIPIKAKAVHCGDAWYDFDGVMTEETFTGKLTNRDSLIVAETVQYKRFLGFLWKTPKVKNRHMDVFSKNPHTQIDDVVYVVIED
jgi:hypothetical protein